MALRAQLQEEDYVAATSLHSRVSRRMSLVGWLAILILALTAAGVWVFGRDRLSAGQLAGLLGGSIGGVAGGLIATFGTRYLYVPWKAKRVFRQQRSLQLPFDFSWDDEGLLSRNEQGSYKHLWSDLLRWKENDRLFLVYISDAMFLILPKRTFSNPEDLISFRTLLQSRVVRRTR